MAIVQMAVLMVGMVIHVTQSVQGTAKTPDVTKQMDSVKGTVRVVYMGHIVI